MGSAAIHRSHIEVGHRLFTLQREMQEVIIRADAIGRLESERTGWKSDSVSHYSAYVMAILR